MSPYLLFYPEFPDAVMRAGLGGKRFGKRAKRYQQRRWLAGSGSGLQTDGSATHRHGLLTFLAASRPQPRSFSVWVSWPSHGSQKKPSLDGPAEEEKIAVPTGEGEGARAGRSRMPDRSARAGLRPPCLHPPTLGGGARAGVVVRGAQPPNAHQATAAGWFWAVRCVLFSPGRQTKTDGTRKRGGQKGQENSREQQRTPQTPQEPLGTCLGRPHSQSKGRRRRMNSTICCSGTCEGLGRARVTHGCHPQWQWMPIAHAAHLLAHFWPASVDACVCQQA